MTATHAVDPTLRRGTAASGGRSIPSVVGAPISFDVVWKAAALLLCLAAAVTAIVITRPEATTAVDVRPASVWLSGETRGRVVLAGARSERPSLAVQIGDDPTAVGEGAAAVPEVEYDVAEGGGAVFVHDRVNGTVQVLDGRDGSEVATVDAPIVTGPRAQIVGAGITAYLVDPAARRMQRLDADGTLGARVVMEQGFTDWGGSADGLLWVVNDADGSYASFDGTALNRTASFATPGTDLTLAVVGVEPVVVDPSTSRLRWIRQNTSFDLGASAALLQDSDPAAECASVLTSGALTCLTPDGPLRQVQVSAAFDATTLADGQLIANRTDAVITRAGTGTVTIIEWASGDSRTKRRAAPSARRTMGTTVTGTIVADDPGSQFAFSVDRGAYVVLDKFSKRTIIIGAGGDSANGVGQIDENADVAGVFTDDAAETAQLDDNGVNDAPRANNDEVVTRVGRSITIDPMANDVDPEDDPLSITQVDPIDPADGSVTVLNGARVAYTPPPTSADRYVSFGYDIVDLGGLTASATIRVEIIGSDRNTAPELGDDRLQTFVGVSADVPVLDNDTDAEGDPLSVIRVSEPEHGTAAIGTDGALRYEPAADFVGRDEFTYRVTDGYGEEAEATVTVDVVEPSAADRPPVARDDRAATSAGVRVRIEALGNDADPDGDPIRIVDVGDLSGVEINIVDNRAIDVLPSTAMSGLLSFSYTISDDSGQQDTGRVSVWVEPVDAAAAPIAVDDLATSASVAIPIDVVVNDVDPNGGQLTIDAWSQPADGQGSVVRLNPTTLQFTPAAGIQGTVQFTYTVRNSANLTADATVTVSVTAPTGSGPVARDDTTQIFPGEIAIIAPLANDSHPDGLPIDFAGPPVVRAGRAVVNGDKTISFTPPNQSLATYRLTYTIQDANLRRSTATITITVVARPVTERSPLANNDVAQTAFGTAVSIDVLGNDEDPDGDALRIDSFTQPASGSVDRSASRLVYTPGRSTSGVVTFSYTIVDDTGRRATANVTVSVAEPVRIAPQATDDLANLIVGASTVVSPLANDIDPDGTSAGLSITGIGAPSGGGLTAVLQGNQVRLNGGQVGNYTVRYTIADNDGLTAVGTISVVVQPVPNSPPNAANDAGTTLPLPFTVDVLANDVDPDGGTLTLVGVTGVSPPTAGSAAISGGQVVYTPSAAFSGTATFGYTVRDPNGATDTATVTITVTPCPALPSTPPISANTRFNTPVTVPLFAAVPTGNAISVGGVNQGTIALQGGGTSVVYTPPAAFNGTATFTYSARNTCGQVANGTVSIVVNRAPVANADAVSTARNTAIPAVPVLANDTDPDLDSPLRVDSVAAGTGGTVTLTAGAILFTPTAGFTGVATFTYRIADPGGLISAPATVRVTVANAAPVAVDDAVSVPTGTSPITINPLTNDTDPGDALVVQSAALSAGSAGTGTVTFTSTSVSFVPAAGFTIPAGSASRAVTITYVVADGTGGGALTDEGLITVTITNRPPVAVSDAASLDLFLTPSVAVNVLANDGDPDGTAAALTITGVTGFAAPASATISGGLVTYTHGSGTVPAGPVILSYTIRDPNTGVASGQITITVTSSAPPTPTTLPPPGP